MSASNTPETSSTIRLHDGRALGYAEVGKSDGFPIFYFHGHDSSRLEVVLWTELAITLGVRLIALDRPGIGRSDLKAGYRLLDWPDDVVEVANQLGIERFAVAAVSGGGAYGLACAYKIPHRLTACGLICSIAPGQLITKDAPLWMRAMWWMGKHLPWLYRLSVRLLMRATGSDAASIEKQLARSSRFLGSLIERCSKTLRPEDSLHKLLQSALAKERGGTWMRRCCLSSHGFQRRRDCLREDLLVARRTRSLRACLSSLCIGSGASTLRRHLLSP